MRSAVPSQALAWACFALFACDEQPRPASGDAAPPEAVDAAREVLDASGAKDAGPASADAASADAASDAGGKLDAAGPALDSGTPGDAANDARGVPVDATALPDGAFACGEAEEMLGIGDFDTAILEGCTIFRGSIRFGDTQRTEVSLPASLRVVEGTLNLFRNMRLVDIRGLHNVHTVGQLLVHHNYELPTLSGLEGLHHVRGQLLLTSNSKLTSLAALSALETAGALVLGDVPDAEVKRLQAQVRIVPYDGGSAP